MLISLRLSLRPPAPPIRRFLNRSARFTIEPVHGRTLAQHRQRNAAGVPLAPWLTYGKLPEDERSARLGQVMRTHWQCPGCGEKLIVTADDAAAHLAQCALAMVKGVAEVKEETAEDHFAPDADEEEGGEGGGGAAEGDEEAAAAPGAPVPPGKRRLDCAACGKSMVLTPPQVLMHVKQCGKAAGGGGGNGGGDGGGPDAAAA